MCSDSISFSLFVEAESCDEVISDHPCCTDEVTVENLPVLDEHASCGCDETIISFLKLSNHSGENSNLEYPLAKQLFSLHLPESLSVKLVPSTEKAVVFPEYSPPENHYFGRYLINFLNQHKIDLIA